VAGILRKVAVKSIERTETRYRTRKLISLFTYIAFALVLIGNFSSSLDGLFVAVGVVGAGVAFALQEVITSIAGWMAIEFGRFFKPGDRIQLGGIKGDVIDIGVLRTTLMECGDWVNGDLYNGKIVRVANGFVFREPVYNYSGEFPFLWDEITIPVKYGSNINVAHDIFSTVLEETVGDFSRYSEEAWAVLTKKYMIENANVAPMISMEANENWLLFTLRYVVDYKKRRSTKNILFTKITEQIEASDKKVQFGGATLGLTELPDVSVKLA